MQFEWDADKAASNFRRHGVSFDEASTVFGDALALTIRDDGHSAGERRFLTVGLSARNRLVVVAHTDRGESLRIISARLASAREKKAYEYKT